MGDYTRKSENYTRREKRPQNTPKTNQNQPAPASVIYTCWRCNRNFDSPTLEKTDTVKCPYCNMSHGQITASK